MDGVLRPGGSGGLPGGFVNEVVRIGDTVRRPAAPSAPFVRALLRLFAERQWPGAPRFLGVDEHGRDIITFSRDMWPVHDLAHVCSTYLALGPRPWPQRGGRTPGLPGPTAPASWAAPRSPRPECLLWISHGVSGRSRCLRRRVYRKLGVHGRRDLPRALLSASW